MNERELSLGDKVIVLASTFEAAALPFAFGGALALAYYAEPRATVDVDVNVFVPPDDIDRVAVVLQPLGVSASAEERRVARRDGQVRLRWERTPLDLFFAYDEFHYGAAERIRRVPFGNVAIPVLAPGDLLVCKVVFDRRKDWIDIEQILLLTAGTLDINNVRDWVVRIVGATDPRVERFDRAVVEVLGPI